MIPGKFTDLVTFANAGTVDQDRARRTQRATLTDPVAAPRANIRHRDRYCIVSSAAPGTPSVAFSLVAGAALPKWVKEGARLLC